MAVIVVDNRVVLDDADADTNWNQGTPITSVYAEATGCIALDVTISTDQIFWTGTAVNFSATTSELIYIWSSNTALQNSWDAGISSSHAAWLSDGTNEIAPLQAGNDRDVFKHADDQVQFQSFLIDIDYLSTKNANGEIYVNTGTFAAFNAAAVTEVGSYFVTLSKALGGGYNTFVDIIRYGTEGLTIYGGTTSTRGIFLEVVSEDRSTLDGKGHGVIREYTAGAYGCQGTLKFGSGTTIGDAWFDDDGISLTFEDRDVMDDKFKFIVLGNVTDNNNFYLSNSSVSSARPGVEIDMSSDDINNLIIDAVSFNNLLNSVYFPTDGATGHTITNSTFNNCGQIDPGTVNFDGNAISNYSGTTGGALLLDVDGSGNWSDLTFTSVGSGHAIYVTSGGTYNFDNFTFIDYGSTGTTDAAIYNNSGEHVTLNILDGTTPEALDGIGSSTSIVSSISINIKVQDSDQTNIQGAYLYITDGLIEVENTLTDSNGEVVSSYSGTQPTGELRIRIYGYEEYSSTLNLTTNVSLTVTLVDDPSQYLPLSTTFDETLWQVDFTGQTVTNGDSGIGDNLPVTTGGTWFVEDMIDFFQYLAYDFASGDTMQYEYPINAVTPTVFEWKKGWGFGDQSNDNKYLYGGSMEESGGTSLWTNLYSIGSTPIGTQHYIIQNDVELEPWWITGDIDLLVRVKDGDWIQSTGSTGLGVDGGLWVYAREIGTNFDHNFIDLSAGGRSPISINSSIDSNNISGELYLSVASASGFASKKFIKGSTSLTVAKIQSVSTNDIYLDSVRVGNFVTSETLTEYNDREATDPTGQSTTNSASVAFTNVVAGYTDITTTFALVSKDLNNGSGSRPYNVVIDCNLRPLSEVYEWLKYIVRYDSSGATYTVNGDDGQEYRNADTGYTFSDLKVAPFGTFAGGKFFGAIGVFIENMAGSDIQNYQLIDNTGTVQNPPEEYSLTLTDIIETSEIRIYTGKTSTGDQGEVAGIESITGSTFVYQYGYSGDFTVDIVIHNVDYVYLSLLDVSLSNSNSSIPIQQRQDQWYDNPA